MISAYGEDADWYRIIAKKEATQVYTGGECFVPGSDSFPRRRRKKLSSITKGEVGPTCAGS